MIPSNRRFTHVLAGASSLVIVMASCDHACSTDAVEHGPTLSLPTFVSPAALELPAVTPLPLGAALLPARPAPKDDVLPPVPAVRPLHEEPPPKRLPQATELDELAIADGHSAMPTSAEWLAEKRMATSHSRCFARVVREWMSIECTTPPNRAFEPLGLVRVLAGDASEVQQWTYNATRQDVDAFARVTAAAVFPVRRGDRRLLEIVYIAHGAHQRFDRAEAYTISVTWLEGMSSPEITVTE